MSWQINLSKEAHKFLFINQVDLEIILGLIKKAIKKFYGEDINVDIKKLKGEWLGFYRIKKGNIRIIVEFDFSNRSALVEIIDWRGDVYK